MFGEINKDDVEISELTIGIIGPKYNLIIKSSNPVTGVRQNVEIHLTENELIEFQQKINNKLNKG